MRCIWVESRHFHALWRWEVTFNKTAGKNNKNTVNGESESRRLRAVRAWLEIHACDSLVDAQLETAGLEPVTSWLQYSLSKPPVPTDIFSPFFPPSDSPLQSVFTQLEISEEKNNRSSICTSLHFNKWDSCFMQLIWWQSGGLGVISHCVERREGRPAADAATQLQPTAVCCAHSLRQKFDTDEKFSGRKSALLHVGEQTRLSVTLNKH